ncbi:hypothetical protein M9H77_07016 [Catharanthus roseus]|uniref:Uncharacterized protein n=1 Tax=Catharanthus roseus TaxID=4058 RepID=A0ACC0BTR5_CATRO|nr:hypothetical protein M9H77_07016 [Catharanthus roseus]
MVDSSCGGTFLHKTTDEAWDLFKNLSDNSQKHATSSQTQIGQLANAISRRDEGKLPSHSIENSRGNYYAQANAIITLRNGNLVDNKVGEPLKIVSFSVNLIPYIVYEELGLGE